ncbi:MAG: UvrB/UvrC motif-containing protein, partial [Aquisalinus sp.]|nr:UvrB/UvrC motif-containing protein [Aquisalinus sp.]
EDGAEFEPGDNLRKHLDALETQMREAASNLEFEEAARLRDEIKRLQEVELTIAADPLARQSAVEQSITDKSNGRITKSEGTVSTLTSKPKGASKPRKKRTRKGP